MTATFRSTSHAVATSASTITIAKPAGVVDGDLLIFSCVAVESVANDSSALISTTGSAPNFKTLLVNEGDDPIAHFYIYTPLINSTSLGKRVFFSVIYKVAQSEPSSYTFNFRHGSEPPQRRLRLLRGGHDRLLGRLHDVPADGICVVSV